MEGSSIGTMLPIFWIVKEEYEFDAEEIPEIPEKLGFGNVGSIGEGDSEGDAMIDRDQIRTQTRDWIYKSEEKINEHSSIEQQKRINRREAERCDTI